MGELFGVGRLGENGEGRSVFHLPEEQLPPRGEAQHSKVGDILGTVCLRQPQESPEDQASDPCHGIAFGFGESIELWQGGGGLDGGVQTLAQSLAAVRQTGEVCLCHGPKPGQDALGAEGEAGRVLPQDSFCIGWKKGGKGTGMLRDDLLS